MGNAQSVSAQDRVLDSVDLRLEFYRHVFAHSIIRIWLDGEGRCRAQTCDPNVVLRVHPIIYKEAEPYKSKPVTGEVLADPNDLTLSMVKMISSPTLPSRMRGTLTCARDLLIDQLLHPDEECNFTSILPNLQDIRVNQGVWGGRSDELPAKGFSKDILRLLLSDQKQAKVKHGAMLGDVVFELTCQDAEDEPELDHRLLHFVQDTPSQYRIHISNQVILGSGTVTSIVGKTAQSAKWSCHLVSLSLMEIIGTGLMSKQYISIDARTQETSTISEPTIEIYDENAVLLSDPKLIRYALERTKFGLLGEWNVADFWEHKRSNCHTRFEDLSIWL